VPDYGAADECFFHYKYHDDKKPALHCAVPALIPFGLFRGLDGSNDDGENDVFLLCYF
jgi:hypothetical protein